MTINLTQKFAYETDSIDSFEKVVDTMIRIMYKEQPTQWSQMYVTKRTNEFEDGKKLIERYGKYVYTQPTLLHICSIGDSKRSVQKSDETFDSYAKLLQRVIAHIKQANKKDFRKVCGDGYNSFFNHDDGSTDVGYRLSKRNTVEDILDVSFCNIYYGK